MKKMLVLMVVIVFVGCGDVPDNPYSIEGIPQEEIASRSLVLLEEYKNQIQQMPAWSSFDSIKKSAKLEAVNKSIEIITNNMNEYLKSNISSNKPHNPADSYASRLD